MEKLLLISNVALWVAVIVQVVFILALSRIFANLFSISEGQNYKNGR